MELMWITTRGVAARALGDLASLLKRPRGFVWLDIAELDDDAARLLEEAFGIEPTAVADCREKSLISKVHPYDGYILLVVHSLDDAGHLMQLTHLIGPRFLVTVHDRFNPQVQIEATLRETAAVRAELQAGKVLPATTSELAFEIATAVAGRLEKILLDAAARAGVLDRRMREDDTGDPERFLDDLFRVRHDLVTVRNRVVQSREAFGAATTLADIAGPDAAEEFRLAQEGFERLLHVVEGELDFLQGVLFFYEHQTNTKMNFAMERLALIAAVILPINAVAGIVGMNTIVNAATDPVVTVLLITLMAAMAGAILWWTKKRGWW